MLACFLFFFSCLESEITETAHHLNGNYDLSVVVTLTSLFIVVSLFHEKILGAESRTFEPFNNAINSPN